MSEQATVHVQQTLTGETTAEPRERPDTWQWCYECESWVLRSAWLPHKDHSEAAEPADDDDDGEQEDEPERAGGVYDITLDYNVTFRFRIPAWSEHEAKDRAKDLVRTGNSADAYLLHSEHRELKEVMTDDPALPDDFDIYDGTMLWEVYDA